jgi:hypothetical protein
MVKVGGTLHRRTAERCPYCGFAASRDCLGKFQMNEFDVFLAEVIPENGNNGVTFKKEPYR